MNIYLCAKWPWCFSGPLPLPSSSRPTLVVVIFIRCGRGCRLFVFVVRRRVFKLSCVVVLCVVHSAEFSVVLVAGVIAVVVSCRLRRGRGRGRLRRAQASFVVIESARRVVVVVVVLA
jgi:hypothetical protein